MRAQTATNRLMVGRASGCPAIDATLARRSQQLEICARRFYEDYRTTSPVDTAGETTLNHAFVSQVQFPLLYQPRS